MSWLSISRADASRRRPPRCGEERSSHKEHPKVLRSPVDIPNIGWDCLQRQAHGEMP